MLTIPLAQDTTTAVVVAVPRDSDAPAPTAVARPSPRVFTLCPDTIVHICEFLCPLDLASVAASCHPLRSLLIVCDAVTWRQQCLQAWRDKQGFRRFCDHFAVHASLLALDVSRNVVSHGSADSTTAQSSELYLGNQTNCPRAGSPQHRRNHAAVKPKRLGPVRGAPSMLLSPETTLRCIRDSILPPFVHTATKSPNGANASPFALPPPATSLGERRLWWELAPHEQVRRLRRIMQSSAASGSSSSDESVQCSPTADDVQVSWKFAYFSSIRDSKRTRITKSELLAAEWTISFAQIPGRSFPVSFREDGTLTTPLHQDGLRYQLSQRGEELNVHVFPALNVTRVEAQQQLAIEVQGTNEGPDSVTAEVSNGRASAAAAGTRTSWGWSIKNHFVCIESKDVPTPEYLNQLHLLCCPRPP